MKLFDIVTEMGHEQVLFCHDPEGKLKAIIAIHDSSLGAAMGATRLYPYTSEVEALYDVLRLSRGMTYKAACANLPVGGGKAVIIAEPQAKNSELLRAYGRFINRLNGKFITGQDVNLTPEDVREIRCETRYVVGISERSGGPAPMTAFGVFLGIKAAVEYRWQQSSLAGMRVAVQGLGNVGKHLCQNLHEQGVQLFVTDIQRQKAVEMQRLYGAEVVEPDEIYALDVDVFSPCALGGILNDSTIARLRSPIIAGAANNQLTEEQAHGNLLKQKGIIYCPDYVINAGGLINVYNEMIGYDEQRAFQQLNNIPKTLVEIFQKADNEQITTHDAAHYLAEERIQKARETKKMSLHSDRSQ